MNSVRQLPHGPKWPAVWAPHWTGGCLFGAAGLAIATASDASRAAFDQQGLAVGVVLTVALVGSAVALMFQPAWGRLLATLSLLVTAGLALRRSIDDPAMVLAGATSVTTLLYLLWFAAALGRTPRSIPPMPGTSRQRGALTGAFAAWVFAMLTVGNGSAPLNIGVAICVGSCGLLGLTSAVSRLRPRSRLPGVAAPLQRPAAHWIALLGSLLTTAGGVAGTQLDVVNQWLPLLLVVQRLTLPSRRSVPQIPGTSQWWEAIGSYPERMFVGTFVSLCLLGTLLLGLPMSSASGVAIGLLDAVFTSVSAVCVTGLIVLDTPHAFSTFGQFVLLLLIQLGGLGIIAFSTITAQLLGHRLSLRHEAVAVHMLSANDSSSLSHTAARSLIFTFAIETVGALLLISAFLARGDALTSAVWRGVFTAVSAFCNAGFALQSDSLIPYQTDAFILQVVAGLIVCGGLSPAVVIALPRLVQGRWSRVSLEMKLSLATTTLLLMGGFTFFAAAEWNGALAGLSFSDRLNNAWFQSVTLRTAGFNSVDFSSLQPATITFMLPMMFIGGSPGGTAGGVKTTTVAVLALSAVETVRGKWVVDAFGRRLSERTRQKTLAVMSLAIGTLLTAVVFLQLTQRIAPEQSVFEVVSALGTVGLSLGATTQLDGFGKLLIAACMFVGRVGGLTFFMFLSQRQRRFSIELPQEDVAVG